jgi:hypothetical protein
VTIVILQQRHDCRDASWQWARLMSMMETPSSAADWLGFPLAGDDDD